MPDARVAAAIENWGPRMIANGVEYNDLRRITASLERWEDWLDAWVTTGDDHRGQAQRAREAGHRVSAGEAFLRAAISYHFAKFVWVLDRGRNRAVTALAVAALADAHALLDPTAERIEAKLGGGHIAANLRRPSGVRRPPLVVLIPGLDSTKEEFFHWEGVFLARGMATLSLDGPGQGEAALHLDIRPDYEVAVAAVLDAVIGRDDLDGARIGAAGVSLGGYYVVRAAAFEPRLRAVAGVSGPYDMSAHWDELPALTRETLAHHSGAASPEAARERAAQLNLDGVAQRVTAPALIVTGARDRLVPWQDTKRVADAIGQARWVLYEDGTHVCNNIPFRYRPLVGDWMADQLAGLRA